VRALLEALLGPADRLLAAVPLSAARWLVVAFLVAAALATFLLPRGYVLLGSPDRRWYRDLRWWAVLIMLPYVVIYAWL
jgi:hypothetical protein